MSTHSSDPPITQWPEWALLESQADLLRQVRAAAKETSVAGATVLFPLLDGGVESIASLRTLVELYRVRDAYVIARVIYETAVNACFILTDPVPLSERAHRHAGQKALRDLERSIELAGEQVMKVKWSGADQTLAHPANRQLLEEFTSKSGREITSWTPENVQRRVEAIYVKFGRQESLGLVYGLLLYRHASEIAHGTLFGALFAWGAMDPKGPPKTVGDIQAFRVEQARLLLMLTGFSLESLVRIAARVLLMPDVGAAARNAGLAFSKRPRPDT